MSDVPSCDEMAALEAKATPGPWHARVDGWTVRAGEGDEIRVALTVSSGAGTRFEVANQEFIAAARAWVPWALERIVEHGKTIARLLEFRAQNLPKYESRIAELTKLYEEWRLAKEDSDDRILKAAHERDVALKRIKTLEEACDMWRKAFLNIKDESEKEFANRDARIVELEANAAQVHDACMDSSLFTTWPGTDAELVRELESKWHEERISAAKLEAENAKLKSDLEEAAKFSQHCQERTHSWKSDAGETHQRTIQLETEVASLTRELNAEFNENAKLREALTAVERAGGLTLEGQCSNCRYEGDHHANCIVGNALKETAR